MGRTNSVTSLRTERQVTGGPMPPNFGITPRSARRGDRYVIPPHGNRNLLTPGVWRHANFDRKTTSAGPAYLEVEPVAKTVKDFVLETLAHSHISSIKFQYGPSRVYPSGFRGPHSTATSSTKFVVWKIASLDVYHSQVNLYTQFFSG